MDRYEFIWKAIQKHGYKYDYRKVNYINVKTKICIICPEHGEFYITPDKHINAKRGCPKCKGRILFGLDSFIEKAKEVHGDKYDYSKAVYKGRFKKLCIVCPEHGEFWQTPANHIGKDNECGCPKCVCEKLRIIFSKDENELIKGFIQIHGNKYNYSKVNYVNNHVKVCVICPEHGEFWQRPSKHLNGQGCPKCKESKLERNISNILSNNEIVFEVQKTFMFLKNGKGFKKLDFYLPYYNIAIECQGEQHFKPVKHWGGNEGFNKRYENDVLKFDLCKENGISVIYVIDESYTFLKKYPYNEQNVVYAEGLMDKIKQYYDKRRD